MTTWTFWRAGLERVVRTMAQTLLGLVGGVQLGIMDVPWTVDLSVTGLSGLVALLTVVVTGASTGAPGVTETPRTPYRNKHALIP